MALLEWGGKRIPVATGELLLGSDASCAVQLTGSGVLPQHAVVRGMPDGQVVIRKVAPQADVMINGVRLGAEPTPLLHGDKVGVGGHELTFVDERRSGSTQYIQAMPPGQLQAAAEAARAARPTGNTGGRVVSLTDGREYAVAGTSLVFGREAGCDVVVAGKDVSRRHAEIMSTPQGYMLVDSSTNGTVVNGEKIQGQRLLARADVIAIGEETFRFYADTIAAAPAPAPAPPPAAPPPPPPAPPPPPPPAPKLQNTVIGASTPRPSTGVKLASFLAQSGRLKGQRYVVKAPVVNIGRADYNDIVVPDESVSTAHAKLQRREGVWVLVDLDSTNGTFVDGERIQGEAALSPGATVRFGDIGMTFEPMDDEVAIQKGGGTRLMEVMKPSAPPPPPAPAAPPKAAPPKAAPPKAAPPRKAPPARRPAATAPAEKKKGKGCGASVVVFALGATAILYWLVA